MNIEEQIEFGIRNRWKLAPVTHINQNIRQENDPTSYHEDYVDWEWILSLCDEINHSRDT
jgi:hypothetical protein